MSIKNIINDEKKVDRIARACFKSVDKDGSGLIDIKELESVMKAIAGDLSLPNPTHQDIKDVFKMLDTDNSGNISFYEFKFLIQCVLESIS